ncbi:MAG: hypothetical protein AAB505_00155 [Patescibacteria group bacterium]
MRVKPKRNKRITSPVKQKVLLLLCAGLVLNFNRSASRQKWLLRRLPGEWRKINRRYLYRIIREFYDERLVNYRESPDGTIDLVITKEGKLHVSRFNLETMKIKQPNRWDGRWRTVFFDIPEKKRSARDALRDKLRDLGFVEFQKSVFVHPYPCESEIDFIIEFFDIRSYVRYAELTKLTNDAPLKLRFNLH